MKKKKRRLKRVRSKKPIERALGSCSIHLVYEHRPKGNPLVVVRDPDGTQLLSIDGKHLSQRGASLACASTSLLEKMR